MINVRCDKQYKALVFEFEGRITLADEAPLMAQLKEILPAKCRSFTILTDISNVESWEPGIQQAVKRIMDFLNAQGVHKIIRVVPDQRKDIGFNIMSIFHYAPEVKVLTVPSREEAFARLGVK